MDGHRLGPADNVQRYRLVLVAAEPADLKVQVASIQGIAESRRWLGRPVETEHALVPGITGQFVGDLPSFLCPVCRYLD